ncbi:zinc finger protein 436 [Dermacentor silvarum]|uniref:zinc finger protein 436 n=1 Tax=Dermacentor silvarum TaxID=543639 RepID=UPI002101A8B8|nr:zinc finger protein 436 [Dermacentor silvarum]
MDDYTTISDEARTYPWNTLKGPTDATYVHELADANENRSPAYWLPLSSSGHSDASFSTSHAGMEELTAILDDDARMPNGTWDGHQNTQYYPADVTSTMFGHTDMTGERSTGYWPPVCSHSCDDAVPSRSRTSMEEASASLENNGRISSGSWGGQWNTQYYPTDVTSTIYGHTDMAGKGGAVCAPLCAAAAAVTQHQVQSGADMEGASASWEINGRYATGTEENEQQELCGVCGKVYTRLHGHACEHYGDESSICEACYLPYVKTQKFVRQCLKSTKEKMYKCETCGKSFTRSWYLKAHQLTHTGIKPYICETCGKSFARLGYLNVHKRTHTDVTPFKCEKCGKSFKQSSHLNAHQRTHTSERPHVCPKCMKSFKHKHSLKEHLNEHTGAIAFVCEICSKSFSYRSSLRVHRLRHADELPHQCARGGDPLAERESLDAHMCEMVTCYFCGGSFRHGIQLATHLVTQRCA